MRVFITGGSGFIGTNLVNDLLRADAEVLNLDIEPPLDPDHAHVWRRGDVMDRKGLRAAFSAFRPTHVVHLAARTDTVGTHRIADYRTNTEGTANVLAAIAATPSVARTII